MARHPGEPRRALVAEALWALKGLAEGPRTAAGEYGAQVATSSTIVARLLSARKEEKEVDTETSPRLQALEQPSGSGLAAPPAKKVW